jgi:hypothetical protein
MKSSLLWFQIPHEQLAFNKIISSFGVSKKNLYKLKEKVIKILLLFATTYLHEICYSSHSLIKPIYCNRLNTVRGL